MLGTEDAPDTQSRPVIDVGNQLVTVADEAWDALISSDDVQHPRVLNHGGSLARVAAERGDALVERYDRDALAARLSRVANFVRMTARGGARSVYPPAEVVRVLLTYPSDPDVSLRAPRLTRVVTAPCYASDRTLVMEPGLHRSSGLYYAPAAPFEPPSAEPTNEEVSTATSALDDLLWDFPFVADADRSNAIALLLLPFVREMIDGPTPLHYVGAPQAGTGKTTLVRVCLAPALGLVPDESGPRDDDEWRKKITAQLLQSPSAVFFDDAGDLDSRPLAQALTSRTWRDRMLGQSLTVDLPVRCAWAATGNNLRVSAPLARRFVPIRLDAELERPWYRGGFRHPGIEVFALAQRPALAWAALTIVQHWVAASASPTGAPIGAARIGYPSYENVVGGILRHAGISGFLDNHAEFTQVEDEEDDLAPFLAAWAALPSSSLTAREIEELLRPFALLSADMPSTLRAIRPDDMPRKLPAWLRDHRDRVSGGLKLVLDTDSGRRRKWTVRAV